MVPFQCLSHNSKLFVTFHIAWKLYQSLEYCAVYFTWVFVLIWWLKHRGSFAFTDAGILRFWATCHGRGAEEWSFLMSLLQSLHDFLIYFLINRTLSWSKWWRAFTCRGASQRLEGVIMCRLCALLCNYVCTKCTCAAAACAMAAMVFVCTQFGLGTGVPTLITSHFGSCFKNWMKHSMCGWTSYWLW